MSIGGFCDNPSLDALLSLKYKTATESGIDVRYEICSFENVNIEDFDLCTVVSNLLDNAIEGCAGTEEKSVHVRIDRRAQRLVVTVKNSSLPVDRELVTTKSDRENHGIGISSIKSAVEKYDGGFAYKYEDGYFAATANMSLE